MLGFILSILLHIYALNVSHGTSISKKMLNKATVRPRIFWDGPGNKTSQINLLPIFNVVLPG